MYQPYQLSDAGSSDLTPGQMLLMGFAGLFTRLDSDFVGLVAAMSSIQGPEAWKKVDMVYEAGKIQVCLLFRLPNECLVELRITLL